MKKKIVIVVNEFQNIINFRLSLINYLSQKNLDISIICYSKKNIQRLNFKNYLNIPIYFLSGNSKGKSIIGELVGVYGLYKLIRSINPELILSFTVKTNLYSSLISKFLKKNIIITIRGLGSTYIDGGIMNKFIFFMYKIFKGKKISYVFQNKDDRNVFKKNNLLKNGNFFLIPGSGVDTNKFKKNLDYIHNSNFKNFNFLFIGRLIKHKGIDEFYKAALKLISTSKTKINFIILGSFDKNDSYSIEKNLYDDIKKNKNFKLVEFSDDVAHFIKKSHCVVLSSKREGMPMSLLEACSIGRPIISSDVPGSKEIVINDYNGYKYKSGNVNDLYKKMLSIVNLPKNKLIAFCNNANQHVKKNFSSNLINDMYYEIIKKKL